MTLAPESYRNLTVAELTGEPTFEELDPSVLRPCDGHASAMVPALVEVQLPVGDGRPSLLDLCGHCARPLGYEHTERRTT